MQKPLEFLDFLNQVHKPNRVNKDVTPTDKDVVVDESWKICLYSNAKTVLKNTMLDLVEYFDVSMNLKLNSEITDDVTAKCIYISVDESLGERNFKIKVTKDNIYISGFDEVTTQQGCFCLEDVFNFREAPFVEPYEETKHIRYSMRLIHTGLTDMEYEGDVYTEENRLYNYKYTNEHLRLIAHAGYTAIKIVTRGAIEDEVARNRVNDIIDRALSFGLDTYAGPVCKNLKHPDDEGAFEYYDANYGKFLDVCPNIKGIILVGESIEFPSKDPRTTGKPWTQSLNDEKPSPGWFPCNDYPDLIRILQKVVKKHKPDLDLVFWTYNWGYEKASLREELLRAVPDDITMMATFEMFENVEISPKIIESTVDYTLWRIGPSDYFKVESKIARERNIKFYSMTSTVGNTWDVGVVPYIPAPQRWIERFDAVNYAQDFMRLDGMCESHTLGFWPSIVTEIGKYAFMSPAPNLHDLLYKIVVRDFGEKNAKKVVKAFKYFSDGMSHCVSTNEDQYGPARIGPSYPLFFKYFEDIPIGPCSTTNPTFESNPVYRYNLDKKEKLAYETKEYKKMMDCYKKGCDILEKVINNMSGAKKEDAIKLFGMCKFIENSARTIYNVKRWHALKGKLGVYVDTVCIWSGGRKNMPDTEKAKIPLVPAKKPIPIINKLIKIAKEEIENAKNTIPLVERDSRLGYTQELEYCTSKPQLLWKIKMTENSINNELIPLLNSYKNK